MHGILVIDKPEGLTSAAVVRQVKGVTGGKVGHLGTLDPFASGILPLCLGEGTKIAQFLNAADKAYEGVIRLGFQTDTGDRTGDEIRRAPLPHTTPAVCRELAATFLGSRSQTPPMYSALKQQGVPLYKLARRGLEVERQPRPIRIDALDLRPLDAERLGFRLECSKGTYVRVLAEEIGAALGSAAHLESLRRTRFGHFGTEHAVRLPLELEAARRALISPRAALGDLLELALDARAADSVRRGQIAALNRLEKPPAPAAAAKLVGPDGSLLAVVVTDPLGKWRFARVLTPH